MMINGKMELLGRKPPHRITLGVLYAFARVCSYPIPISHRAKTPRAQRLLSGSLFTRKLEYKAENFAAVKELEKVMRDQSEQGVKQLKVLVQKILSEEAKPLT